MNLFPLSLFPRSDSNLSESGSRVVLPSNRKYKSTNDLWTQGFTWFLAEGPQTFRDFSDHSWAADFPPDLSRQEFSSIRGGTSRSQENKSDLNAKSRNISQEWIHLAHECHSQKSVSCPRRRPPIGPIGTIGRTKDFVFVPSKSSHSPIGRPWELFETEAFRRETKIPRSS
jgi:hypothetical protein